MHFSLALADRQYRQTTCRTYISIQKIIASKAGSQSGDCVVPATACRTADTIERIVSTHCKSLVKSEKKTTITNSHFRDNGCFTPTTNGQGNSYVAIQTKAITTSCRNHCPCRCHIPFEGRTPRWLRGLVGDLFFSCVGTPVLNYRSCDVGNCGDQSGTGGGLNFQYTFPAWAFKRSISLTADYTDLSGAGATWRLKVPQYISSIETTSKFVKRFQALPHDTCMSDILGLMSTLKVRPMDRLNCGPDYVPVLEVFLLRFPDTRALLYN